MKSQTSLAARNCRLQEWSQMVHSCNNRPIGMSVNEWCRENSITTANYYYRMTQVRKACLDSLSDEAVNQEVVSVPTSIQCLSPAKKYFANKTKYAPYLHELGHKFYYDTIKSIAREKQIGYTKARGKEGQKAKRN